MSVFKTYIGDLEDPVFVWNPDERAYNKGNAPRPVSPLFPTLRGVESIGFHLVCKIATGEFSGKQVDSGCWVAKATKAQIINFINGYYLWAECGGHCVEVDSTFEMEYSELLSYISLLESGRQYGLVARESVEQQVSRRVPAGKNHKREAGKEPFQHKRLA